MPASLGRQALAREPAHLTGRRAIEGRLPGMRILTQAGGSACAVIVGLPPSPFCSWAFPSFPEAAQLRTRVVMMMKRKDEIMMANRWFLRIEEDIRNQLPTIRVLGMPARPPGATGIFSRISHILSEVPLRSLSAPG